MLIEDGVGELVLTRLALLDVNNNSCEPGSRWDRHEQLGAGRIGERGFEALFSLGWPRCLPGILETPKSPASADRRNVNWLR
jgi:endonuclease IV